MIFLPVTAKLVTLGELKTSYTLRDYMDLMGSTSEMLGQIQEALK